MGTKVFIDVGVLTHKNQRIILLEKLLKEQVMIIQPDYTECRLCMMMWPTKGSAQHKEDCALANCIS